MHHFSAPDGPGNSKALEFVMLHFCVHPEQAPILGGFHLFYCSPPQLRIGLKGLGGITRCLGNWMGSADETRKTMKGYARLSTSNLRNSFLLQTQC